MPDPTPEQVQTLAQAIAHARAHPASSVVGRATEADRQYAETLLEAPTARQLIADERADAARQALAPVLALADEWDRESQRYRRYVEASSIPDHLASVATSLAQNVSALRAAAGGGEGQ